MIDCDDADGVQRPAQFDQCRFQHLTCIYHMVSPARFGIFPDYIKYAENAQGHAPISL